MSLIPFIVIVCTGIGVTAVLADRPRLGSVVSVAAGLAAAVALLAVPGTDAFTVNGISFVATAYARDLAAVGLLVGLLVTGISALDEREIAGPPALLAGALALVLAAACSEFSVALTLVGATALVASGLALARHGRIPGRDGLAARVVTLGRETRGVVAALLGGLAAVALLGNGTPASGAGGLPVEDPVAGFAVGVVGAALIHRMGSIPLHGHVVRLSRVVEASALPVLAVIVPAAWAVVFIGWGAAAGHQYADGLGAERGLLVLVGLATLVLGTLAAFAAPEVEDLVAYTIVAEAGIGLLALGTLAPETVANARAWLVIFVAGRTALIGWSIAFRATYGTGRIRDVGGWVRRTPILAVGLVLIAVATTGWPGLLAWNARIGVLQQSTAGPLLLLGYAGSLGTLAAVARLIVIGLGRPTDIVAAAQREIPMPGRAAADDDFANDLLDVEAEDAQPAASSTAWQAGPVAASGATVEASLPVELPDPVEASLPVEASGEPLAFIESSGDRAAGDRAADEEEPDPGAVGPADASDTSDAPDTPEWGAAAAGDSGGMLEPAPVVEPAPAPPVAPPAPLAQPRQPRPMSQPRRPVRRAPAPGGVAAALGRNRTPVRSLAVIVLAAAALLVASGGLGLASAAAEPPVPIPAAAAISGQ